MKTVRADALDRAFELADRLGSLMHEALTSRGLTPGRAHVLVVLRERGPVVQRELSEALGRSPRHVTTLVDVLEADGFVVRRPHPRDRRATLVELTERGEAETSRMQSERKEAARVLLQGATADELAAFVATADRLLGRLDDFARPRCE